MGNCCKKKEKDNKNPKAGEGGYTRIKDSALTRDQNTIGGSLGSDSAPLPGMAGDRVFNGEMVDLEAGHPKLDEACIQWIKTLDLGPQFDQVKSKIDSYNKGDLKKLTDDKDSFTMYFDVKADENKDKFHVSAAVCKSHLSPLAFKLANALISEADELKMTSSYERFYTLFRAKIDGIYYIVNYALYKQIMLFSKKDLLFLKAFKEYDNGDVAEITVSINHPEFEEKPKIERMKIIESMAYITKTDNGCTIETLTQMYPKVNAGITILKPLFAKSFRAYFKTLDEYLVTVKSDQSELNTQFEKFKKANF